MGNSEIGASLDTSLWHPRAQRLYGYWRSIAPQGALPGRQHFDPMDVPDLLSCLWLLDVQRDPFRLRYRLAGTAIVEAIGREVTGQWLDEAHPHIEDRGGFLARYSGWSRAVSRAGAKAIPGFGPTATLIWSRTCCCPLRATGTPSICSAP